ncbi:hypothetical protein [Streptomyces sp. NPDC006879]|uniref:hypothetical protein n=1 Tax=Streptomyces sp. NPDC006879 TaxID=3364767 RepID=UPI00368A5EE7
MSRPRPWQTAIERAETAGQAADSARLTADRMKQALNQDDAARAADRIAATWTRQEEVPQ